MTHQTRPLKKQAPPGQALRSRLVRLASSPQPAGHRLRPHPPRAAPANPELGLPLGRPTVPLDKLTLSPLLPGLCPALFSLPLGRTPPFRPHRSQVISPCPQLPPFLPLTPIIPKSPLSPCMSLSSGHHSPLRPGPQEVRCTRAFFPLNNGGRWMTMSNSKTLPKWLPHGTPGLFRTRL